MLRNDPSPCFYAEKETSMWKSMLAGLIKMAAPMIEQILKDFVAKFLENLDKKSSIPANSSASTVNGPHYADTLDETIKEFLSI